MADVFTQVKRNTAETSNGRTVDHGRSAVNVRQSLFRATSRSETSTSPGYETNPECQIPCIRRAKRRPATFSIGGPTDETSDVTSVAISGSGTVLAMTDFAHSAVKLFDAKSHTLTSSISFPDEHLWDISFLSTYDAIVTCPNVNNGVYFVNTFDKSSRLIELGATNEEKFNCFGVCFNKDVMYSTTMSPGKIRTTKYIENPTIRDTQTDSISGCNIQYPAYIKVNQFGIMFISDMDSECVFVIQDGSCKHVHCTHPGKPYGLSEYKDGSMFVAIQNERSDPCGINVISADGCVMQPFLSKATLGGPPNNVCYNPYRDELVVVYANKDQARVFYLE